MYIKSKICKDLRIFFSYTLITYGILSSSYYTKVLFLEKKSKMVRNIELTVLFTPDKQRLKYYKILQPCFNLPIFSHIARLSLCGTLGHSPIRVAKAFLSRRQSKGIDFINHVSTCSMPLTNDHIGNIPMNVWQIDIGIYCITMICKSSPTTFGKPHTKKKNETRGV